MIYGRTIARPSKSRLFVRLHDAPPGPLSGVRSNKHECEKEEHIKCDHHKRDIASYRIVVVVVVVQRASTRRTEREKDATTKKTQHAKSKYRVPPPPPPETTWFLSFLTSPLGTGLSSGARKTCTVARCLYLSSTLDSTESLNLRLCSSSRLPRRLRPPPRLRVQEWTGRDLLGLARRACTRPCGTAPRGLFSRALRPSAAGRR